MIPCCATGMMGDRINRPLHQVSCRMAGAVNVAPVGHLGIVIGCTDEKVRAMFRVRQYLRHLGDVRKPTIWLVNLLILGRKQAIEAFNSD